MGRARADLVVYTDRTTFNSAGTIAFNSNFNDFGTGFSFPGDPFTRGDVTYTSEQNLITGTATGYNPVTNLMTDNYWSPVTGTINATPQYSLFGFDIGVLDRLDRITVDITTNLATYDFPLLSLANGTQSLQFLGYGTTGAGEYITGFSLTTEFGPGSLPGITNVAVGVESLSTPEPSTLAMIASAVPLGIGAWLRRASGLPDRRLDSMTTDRRPFRMEPVGAAVGV
jgi:hypothetical protein